VLAWALGRFELPPYDEQVCGADVAEELGFLERQGAALLAFPEVRDADEIAALADHVLTVHWRLREFGLRPHAIDFPEVIRRSTWGLTSDRLVFAEGDLALRGIRIDEATADLRQQCRSIATERQQAANWLLGNERVYSEVTCDT
jgi:hypothetical protein